MTSVQKQSLALEARQLKGNFCPLAQHITHSLFGGRVREEGLTSKQSAPHSLELSSLLLPPPPPKSPIRQLSMQTAWKFKINGNITWAAYPPRRKHLCKDSVNQSLLKCPLWILLKTDLETVSLFGRNANAEMSGVNPLTQDSPFTSTPLCHKGWRLINSDLQIYPKADLQFNTRTKIRGVDCGIISTVQCAIDWPNNRWRRTVTSVCSLNQQCLQESCVNKNYCLMNLVKVDEFWWIAIP